MSAQNIETNLGKGERRALRASLWVAVVLSGLGISIGIIGNSQVILFDGFYTLVGVALTSLALRAAALSGRGVSEHYPFGREALVPLVLAIEGVALSATCLYAAANAIVELVRGGTGVPGGVDIVYAIVVSVVPSALWWWLRRIRGSELVVGEAQAWGSAAVLGIAMVVAFSVARALVGGSWARGASYIDPSLVLVAAAMFVAAPIRMMRRTLFELIEGSVTSSVGSIINDVVGNVEGEYGLKDPVIRMSKVGRKVYVEVGYVVGSGWTVADGDSMRRRLRESLGETGLTTWLTLEFSLAHENLL